MVTEKQFEQYLEVQNNGLYNMLDPRAREMTDLTKDEWIYIIENYNELSKKYNEE